MFRTTSNVSYDSKSHIYYDITMASTLTRDNVLNDPPVRFSESRTEAFIDDCSKYNLAIIRFTMDGCGTDLPMWLPQIMTDDLQATLPSYSGYDPNKTIYCVSLSASVDGVDASFSVYLEWTPEVVGISTGAPQYYYCSSYAHFCDMFNTAVLSAYNNVKEQVGGSVTTRVPFLTYSGASNLFTLYCDSFGFAPDNTGNESWNMYFDVNLYQLLNSFQTVYTPNTTLVSPLAYQVVIKNSVLNTITNAYTNYYAITQDFPSTDASWSPVQSIVFTTTLLPVIPEQTGAPILITDSNSTGITSSVANFQNVITDIAIAVARSSDYKGFIEYVPTPYRMIPLSDAKMEIRQFDINVNWKDRSGVLRPLTMSNNACVSLKLLFRAKELGI
jgi:hypothetical protein